jgi:hypothetical protein
MAATAAIAAQMPPATAITEVLNVLVRRGHRIVDGAVYEGLGFVRALNWLTIDNGDEAFSPVPGRQRDNSCWIMAYENGVPSVLAPLHCPIQRGPSFAFDTFSTSLLIAFSCCSDSKTRCLPFPPHPYSELGGALRRALPFTLRVAS